MISKSVIAGIAVSSAAVLGGLAIPTRDIPVPNFWLYGAFIVLGVVVVRLMNEILRPGTTNYFFDEPAHRDSSSQTAPLLKPAGDEDSTDIMPPMAVLAAGGVRTRAGYAWSDKHLVVVPNDAIERLSDLTYLIYTHIGFLEDNKHLSGILSYSSVLAERLPLSSWSKKRGRVVLGFLNTRRRGEITQKNRVAFDEIITRFGRAIYMLRSTAREGMDRRIREYNLKTRPAARAKTKLERLSDWSKSGREDTMPDRREEEKRVP